jgi:hypothetical protein
MAEARRCEQVPASRLPVLRRLAGVHPGDATAIRAITEWNDIDILATIDRGSNRPLHVAIEYKIKSAESTEQLTRYDAVLSTLPGEVAKVLLTLTGDEPVSGSGWRPASYQTLLAAVSEIQPASIYVSDLCDSLGRLVAVAREALQDAGLMAFAFGDDDSEAQTPVARYVDEMRLQKVVQRIWMSALASRLPVHRPWRARVDETHGQALLDLEGALEDRPGYRVGLQLQGRTLKAFCSPYPYPERASDRQHEAVTEILELIRGGLRLDKAAKASRRRSRGFRSFSIAALPRDRDPTAWRQILDPFVQRLAETFPKVREVAPGEAAALEDD